MNRRTIAYLVTGLLLFLGLAAIFTLASRPNKPEVVVESGVGGIYAVHNNIVYYRSGESLVAKDIKKGSVSKVAASFNTASLSEDGSQLFIRTMKNYRLEGQLYDLNSQVAGKTTYKNFVNNLWCDNELFLVREQQDGNFSIINSSETALYRNVPTTEVFCINGELVYDSTVATSLTYHEREPKLVYLSKDMQSNKPLSLGGVESSISQNGGGISYINAQGSFVLASKSGLKEYELNLDEALVTENSQSSIYLLTPAKEEQNELDLIQIDTLNGNNAVVKSYTLEKSQNFAEPKDREYRTIYVADNYLYFILDDSIVRVKL